MANVGDEVLVKINDIQYNAVIVRVNVESTCATLNPKDLIHIIEKDKYEVTHNPSVGPHFYDYKEKR